MKTLASAAGAIVAVGLFAVAGFARATVMIAPDLPGTVMGTTQLIPHETVEYTFTIPAPYAFLFSFSDGMNFTTSGSSGSFVETFTNSPSSSIATYSLTTTAAPEPASWALLMVGFGGIGAVARHRKTLASS